MLEKYAVLEAKELRERILEIDLLAHVFFENLSYLTKMMRVTLSVV